MNRRSITFSIEAESESQIRTLEQEFGLTGRGHAHPDRCSP